MEEKNCELLFSYLKSILYDEQGQKLNLEELDEPYRKLGQGLQYLDKAVHEMKEYSDALATGHLSVIPPPRDNFLCENLKTIHANLNHLTWQAKQVAKGDYSQTVSYLGEFSEAFNTMTHQLSEREELFKEAAARERIYASHDTLTGVGNRYYLQQKMENIMQQSNAQLVFCYCDLDHLKHINDTYGHAEGDWYLCHFTELVKQSIRHDDVFARVGGDEFCLILSGCIKKNAEKKMQRILKRFREREEKPYDKSFSYGIVEIPSRGESIQTDELIRQADKEMYLQKKNHKEQYSRMTM